MWMYLVFQMVRWGNYKNTLDASKMSRRLDRKACRTTRRAGMHRQSNAIVFMSSGTKPLYTEKVA